jgi:hypothetical protein
MSVCTAIVVAGLTMKPSSSDPRESALARAFAALRSTCTSIYQAKLPAKILFSDTKQSFYLCSADNFRDRRDAR